MRAERRQHSRAASTGALVGWRMLTALLSLPPHASPPRVPSVCLSSNNMLYPRENRLQKKLYYACRNCSYQQEAASPCVYVNEIKQSITSDTRPERKRGGKWIRPGRV